MLSAVDLLALASLDQLIFILKILFQIFDKLRHLNEEVNGIEPSSLESVPWLFTTDVDVFIELI